MASVLSVALEKMYSVKLIYCFEKNGVLTDVANEHSALEELSKKDYAQLKEQNKLFAGILPKIDNAFNAITSGVQEVVIGNSANLLQLVQGSGGTKIVS
jgi:acetylglutamate kinase